MSEKSSAGSSHNKPRIKVTGVRKKEIDTKRIAEVYWMMAERAVKEKRVAERVDGESGKS